MLFIALVTGAVAERFIRGDVTTEEEAQTTLLLARLDDVCSRLERIEAELRAARHDDVRRRWRRPGARQPRLVRMTWARTIFAIIATG